MSVGKKILFQLSGSIACYKACQAISQLVQAGHEVQTVASQAALQFLGEATLEGLTGKPVLKDTFRTGEMMNHIRLARWADILILCPATANKINSLAAGVAEDLIGTLFLAHDFSKPYLVAPAMNSAMFEHPVTAASVEKLQSLGVQILPAEEGRLACGEQGEGRLISPERLVGLIEQSLGNRSSMTVVVTSGATMEPIDGVRYLTNFSSGRTAAAIADHFLEMGAKVIYLHGNSAALPKRKSEIQSFDTAQDLDSKLRMVLASQNVDAVIHAAAIGDFRTDYLIVNGHKILPTRASKVDSGSDLQVVLKGNPKIVQSLREYSANKHVTIIAFKLTNGASEVERDAAVSKLTPYADFVVHNDLEDLKTDPSAHPAVLFGSGKVLAQIRTKSELAGHLYQVVHDLKSEECL